MNVAVVCTARIASLIECMPLGNRPINQTSKKSKKNMWVELNDEQSHPIQSAVVAHQKENGNLMSRDRLKTVAREEKKILFSTQRFTRIARASVF